MCLKRTIFFLLFPLLMIVNAQHLRPDFSPQKYAYFFGNKSISLKEALDFLQEIYQINFMYEDVLIEGKVCPPFKKITKQFHKDLQHVLGKYAIQYIRVSPKTFVLFKKKAVLSNRRIIRGRVLDTAGNPIPDAEVFIEGTVWGAAVNAQGNYEIKNIPEGKYTLVSRCMGYRPAFKDVIVPEVADIIVNFILEVDILNMEEIVTIASRNPLTKLESSVAITTANSIQIAERSPRSTADLLKAIPGFYVESSGGISGNNLFPRGLPQDGSYRYVAIFEDGIPIFEAPELSFANIDIFTRVDETITQLEGLRGGTCSIFASNAPGGIINFISKTGGNKTEFLTKISIGDRGLYRFDYNIGGPLFNNFRFNVGGFLRYESGIRYPGYAANKGGQVKANFTWLFRKGYWRIFTKYLNDRNVFYMPIPLQDPKHPESIPGLDAHYGTMASVHASKVYMPTPRGTQLFRDLSNGIHPELYMVASDFNLGLGKGWMLQNISRYMHTQLEHNAIFSMDNPYPATYFAETIKQVDTLRNYGYYEYRYADTGEIIENIDQLNGNGLVTRNGWWAVDKTLYSITNITIVKKNWHSHNISAGFYLTRYGAKDFWYWHNILTEVKSIPRLLDLIVYDQNGKRLLSVTKNGFEQYGSFYVNADNNALIAALSLVDEWKITDRIRFDIGGRIEYNRFRGQVENIRNDFTVGNGESLAEQRVQFGDGTFRHYLHRFTEWAVTSGLNYSIHPHLAVYSRVSRGYRMPDFDQWLFSNDCGKSQYVFQAEGGIKFASERFAIFSTLFFSSLNNIPFLDEMVVKGRIIKKSRFAQSMTYGSEWEAILYPVQNLEINLISTIQDPRLYNFRSTTIDPQTGEQHTIILDGKQVRRIPWVLMDTRLSYRLGKFKIFTNWQYVGERFVDDANTARLPAFNVINAGIVYSWKKRGIRLSLIGGNLTNCLGLTEGNPRVDQVFAQRNDQVFMARPILGRSFILSATYILK